MKKYTGNILVGAVALLVLFSLSMFVVDQRQTAIDVARCFGVKRNDVGAGLGK